MKGLPPFNFEGKEVINLGIFTNNFPSSYYNYKNNIKEPSFFLNYCGAGDSEPTSVLDTVKIHSPPNSHTLGGASSGGGGGGASQETSVVAAVSGNSSTKWHLNATSATSPNIVVDSKFEGVPQSFPMGVPTTGTVAGEKCSLEEWDSVLPESVAASPSQEQNVLRWIMGDVDDPSMANLNKALQIGGGGGGHQGTDYDFNGGFGVVDQEFGGESVGQGINFMPNVNVSMSNSSLSGPGANRVKTGFLETPSGNVASSKLPNAQNQMFTSLGGNVGTIAFNQEQQQVMQQALPFSSDEMRSSGFNPQVLINQQQSEHPRNPTFFMPLPYGEQEQNLLMPPHAKRHNPGTIAVQFSDTGQESFTGRNLPLQQHKQQEMPQGLPYQLQLLPDYLQKRPATGLKPKTVGEDVGLRYQQQQQAVIDQLYKALDFVQNGNPLLAQTILARLNQQLSPIGKPFFRVSFYFTEALQLLLNNNSFHGYSATLSPSSLISKIGAYKSFSEVSPIVQFANFTCNQALLEVLQGYERIHIIDFDIGYGGQWASFIQEVALRSGGAPSLKITAFSSPLSHDQLQLGLARENLKHFASEINMKIEFEVVNTEALSSGSWSLPFHISDDEAIGVNLPLSSFTNCHLPMPLVLHFVKQLSPKIVVSIDRGCDRTDLPFTNHIIQTLHYYSNLLESIDAVNVNSDSLQKIERFLIQPGIEKILLNRYRSPDKTQHWKTIFLSSGFSPLTFSNFTESLGECVVKRTPVRGFHFEKRHSSFVLCWQRQELISTSAWRC